MSLLMEKAEAPTAVPVRTVLPWQAILPVAWLLIFGAALVLEPAPTDPNATPGVIDTVLGTALTTSWIVMLVGLSARRRIGALASLMGAPGCGAWSLTAQHDSG